MAYKRLDSTQQLATGNGTGPLTLAGSSTSELYFTFAQAGMVDGDTASARIQHETIPGEWELVTVTFNGGVLTRTFDAAARSPINALIPFSPGNKVVTCVPRAGDPIPGVLTVNGSGDATAPRDFVATRGYIGTTLTLNTSTAGAFTYNVNASNVQNDLISQESVYDFTGHSDGSADIRRIRSRNRHQGAFGVAKMYDQYIGMETYGTDATGTKPVVLVYGIHQFSWVHRAQNVTRIDQFFCHPVIRGDDVAQNDPTLRAIGNIGAYNAFNVGPPSFDLTPGSTDTGRINFMTGLNIEPFGSELLRIDTARGITIADTTARDEVSGIYSLLTPGGVNPTGGKYFIRHEGGAPSRHKGEFVIDRGTPAGGTTERALRLTNLGTGATTGLIVSFDLNGQDNNRDPRILAINTPGGGSFGAFEFYTVNGAAPARALRLDHTKAATFDGAVTMSLALTYGGVTLSNAVTGTGSMVLSSAPTFARFSSVRTIGAAPAGNTLENQYSNLFSGDAGGSTDFRQISQLYTASGGNAIASMKMQNLVATVNMNTGVTVANSGGISVLVTQQGGGTITTSRIIEALLQFSTGDGVVVNPSLFYGRMTRPSGTGLSDATGTARVFYADDSGGAHVAGNLIGFDAAASGTLSDTSKINANFRANNSSGTNRFGFLSSGSALNQLAGPLSMVAAYIDISEMTAPAAPAVNTGRLYVDDTGGKSRLNIRFNTGAVAVLATEP